MTQSGPESIVSQRGRVSELCIFGKKFTHVTQQTIADIYHYQKSSGSSLLVIYNTYRTEN